MKQKKVLLFSILFSLMAFLPSSFLQAQQDPNFVGPSTEEEFNSTSKPLYVPPTRFYDDILGDNKVVNAVRGSGLEDGARILVDSKANPVMKLIKQVLAAIAIMNLVYIGFKLILSQGNEEQLGKYNYLLYTSDAADDS